MCFCCLFIGREEFSFICLHGASGFGFFCFGGVLLDHNWLFDLTRG